MDIRCPSCNTLYEFNEARLKPKGVNLKCSQCGHVFRVEGRKEKTTGSSKRWMVRKIADGEVLYFQGLATLQKWIIDRKVGRQDQISRSGASWKDLADIGELSSFFQVAESIERLQQAQSPPSGSGLAAAAATATATASLDAPVPEYFDPLAPGDSSIDASMGLISLNPPAEPDVVVTESLKPPPKPLGATSRDHSTRVSYQESDEQYSPVPLIVAVLILLLLVVGIYVYLKKPEYLGMPPKDKAPIAKTVDKKGAQAQTDKNTKGASPDAKLPDAGNGSGKTVAAKPDAGTSTSDKPDAGTSAANTTNKTGETPDAGLAQSDKKADAGTGLVNLNNGGSTNGGDNNGNNNATGDKNTAGADGKTPGDDPKKAVASTKPVDDKGVAANTTKTDKNPAKVEPKTTPETTPKTNKTPNKTVARNNTGKAKPAKARPISGGLMKQGLQALRAGNGKGALDAFERAASANPGSAAAWRGKGWAYLQLGIPNASIQNFKKALAINPRYGDALIGLARAYRQSGQKGQAVKTYQKYLNFYPSGPQASAARAQLERLGGKAP